MEVADPVATPEGVDQRDVEFGLEHTEGAPEVECPRVVGAGRDIRREVEGAGAVVLSFPVAA